MLEEVVENCAIPLQTPNCRVLTSGSVILTNHSPRWLSIELSRAFCNIPAFQLIMFSYRQTMFSETQMTSKWVYPVKIGFRKFHTIPITLLTREGKRK